MANRIQTSAYLMPSEVADILHVSNKTVARWSKEGKLPFTRTLGGHRRYKEDDIRKLLADMTVTPKHRT